MRDKRTYTKQKEHGEDMSYESEVEHKFDDRGNLDLTKQIDVLQARIADLESIEETHKKLNQELHKEIWQWKDCLLYTSPSPRDGLLSRMPSSA